MVALSAIAVYVSHRPPAPLPASADPSRASAERARDVLQRLLGDQAPHPTGSPAQERLRERLLSELRALGLKPELQSGTSCGRFGVCGRVHNVVARLAGREPGPALLIVSHYDSVPAGPGAGDDGSGVAVALEVVRALRAGPALRNPIVLLFSDGEEFGLLGAELWASDPRNIREIGAVINLEARGSSGPSLMFETGAGNLPLLRRFSEAVARPITSSAFYAVYKRMPNDTDFSVFKARGLPGLNFAFIGNVEHYHTPLDDLGHLELTSLQHQADNALATARALADGDLRALSSRDDAVFFDLFARQTLVWPARLMLPASLAALALLVGTLIIGFWRRALAPLAFVGALFGWPLAMALCGGDWLRTRSAAAHLWRPAGAGHRQTRRRTDRLRRDCNRFRGRVRRGNRRPAPYERGLGGGGRMVDSRRRGAFVSHAGSQLSFSAACARRGIHGAHLVRNSAVVAAARRDCGALACRRGRHLVVSDLAHTAGSARSRLAGRPRLRNDRGNELARTRVRGAGRSVSLVAGHRGAGPAARSNGARAGRTALQHRCSAAIEPGAASRRRQRRFARARRHLLGPGTAAISRCGFRLRSSRPTSLAARGARLGSGGAGASLRDHAAHPRADQRRCAQAAARARALTLAAGRADRDPSRRTRLGTA